MHVSKTRTSFPNLEIGGAHVFAGRDVTPNAAGGVRLTEQAIIPRRAQFRLAAKSIAITAASDFASLKLCDLPDGNLVIIGAKVDLVATGTGGVSVLANIDLALGTVATASTDFSNAGEDDIVPKLDATAGGVIEGGPTSTEALTFLAASSDSLYLNLSDAIATDGTIVLTGFIELVYIDLGDPSA